MSSGGGRGKAGISGGAIIVLLGIIALIVSGVAFKSIFKVVLIIVLIVFGLLICAVVLIVVLARKGSEDEEEKRAAAKAAKTGLFTDGLTDEEKEALQEGRKNLLDVRMAASKIRDMEVHASATELCNKVEHIFRTLKEKPGKIVDQRQLMKYYLPTTQKVLGRFASLETSGTLAEDASAKTKSFLTDMSAAMDKLYANLFDEDKLNMEVEMEAMTIAIKRDGLLPDGYAEELNKAVQE